MSLCPRLCQTFISPHPKDSVFLYLVKENIETHGKTKLTVSLESKYFNLKVSINYRGFWTLPTRHLSLVTEISLKTSLFLMFASVAFELLNISFLIILFLFFYDIRLRYCIRQHWDTHTRR